VGRTGSAGSRRSWCNGAASRSRVFSSWSAIPQAESVVVCLDRLVRRDAAARCPGGIPHARLRGHWDGSILPRFEDVAGFDQRFAYSADPESLDRAAHVEIDVAREPAENLPIGGMRPCARPTSALSTRNAGRHFGKLKTPASGSAGSTGRSWSASLASLPAHARGPQPTTFLLGIT